MMDSAYILFSGVCLHIFSALDPDAVTVTTMKDSNYCSSAQGFYKQISATKGLVFADDLLAETILKRFPIMGIWIISSLKLF